MPPPYVLNLSCKRKIATCHLYKGCWCRVGRELKNYQYVYDINDLGEDVEFCRDCCPEYRESIEAIDEGSSSTKGRTSEEVEEEIIAKVIAKPKAKVKSMSEAKTRGKERAADD